MDNDLSYMKVEKKTTKEHPFDPFTHKFVIILMARLLARDFQKEYVFADHPGWDCGPWKLGDGEVVLDVAVGDKERGSLVAAIEVETRSSLESGIAKDRWTAAGGANYLDVVVPEFAVRRVPGLAKDWDVSLHDIWSYSIEQGNVKLVRAVKNEDGFLGEAGEIEGELMI